jgi:hypothetical protein
MKTTVLRILRFSILKLIKKNYTRLKIIVEILRIDGSADVVESKKIPRLSRQKSAAELQIIGIVSRRRKTIDLGLW